MHTRSFLKLTEEHYVFEEIYDLQIRWFWIFTTQPKLDNILNGLKRHMRHTYIRRKK